MTVSAPVERLGRPALESHLWGAASLLRGLVDAGDYKQYVFPLLFFKRLSDVWDEERRAALDETGDEGYARATADDRFAIPAGAHWSDVRGAARDVGRALRNAFRALETANPDRLAGVFGAAPWTDKAQMPDATLKNLIEHFSRHTLSTRRGARRRAGQRLRVPRQAVRRRQRPHRAGVLHQPHPGAPDDADAPTAARRAHLRPDRRRRRHAHLGPGRGAAAATRARSASTGRRSSARRRRSRA